jgi:Type IIA topoisomerase (DNA gyrase/topo II, topoisomerase IV), A subunit
VVEGLLMALDRWADVSAVVVGESPDGRRRGPAEGGAFNFSSVQVEWVLDLPLARRTAAARAGLEEEAAALRRLAER